MFKVNWTSGGPGNCYSGEHVWGLYPNRLGFLLPSVSMSTAPYFTENYVKQFPLGDVRRSQFHHVGFGWGSNNVWIQATDSLVGRLINFLLPKQPFEA